MLTSKEKIIKGIKKGVKELELMQAGKLQGPTFQEMIEELKSDKTVSKSTRPKIRQSA